MKRKNYIKPFLKIEDIQCQELICSSNNISVKGEDSNPAEGDEDPIGRVFIWEDEI